MRYARNKYFMEIRRVCWSAHVGLLFGLFLFGSRSSEFERQETLQTITLTQGPVWILDDSFDPSFRSEISSGIPSSFGPMSAVNPLESVSIQPDGKIVVGGIVSSDDGAFFGLARLNANGEVDSTFRPGTTLGFVNAHAMDHSGDIYAHTLFDNAESALVKTARSAGK